MTNNRIYALAITAAALIAGALVSLAGIAPSAAAQRGVCVLTKLAYSTSTTFASSNTGSFETVPGTKFTFIQSQAGCVVVGFSAVGVATAGNVMSLETVLDGSTPCEPGPLQFMAAGSFDDARATTFVCPAVAAGRHTVMVQQRSHLTGTGAFVRIDRFTMTLQYR